MPPDFSGQSASRPGFLGGTGDEPDPDLEPQEPRRGDGPDPTDDDALECVDSPDPYGDSLRSHLAGLQSRMGDRFDAVEAKVADVRGRMNLLDAAMTTVTAGQHRAERVQASILARLDDLAPRLSAVEKPAIRKGLGVAGRYGAAVAAAGALAQLWAAADPDVAAALKAVGEALRAVLGGG